MDTVVTLTFNPVLDLNTAVEQVAAERKLRCEEPVREPGGGGLNVSRALQALGGASTAWYLAGGPTGQVLAELLDREGVAQRRFAIDGWTREGFHVSERSSERQFRFGMPGPRIAAAEWQAVLAALEETEPPPALLAVSGSLPPGAPDDLLARLARRAADSDCRLLLDCPAAPTRRALEAGVYLIEPNLRELCELVGDPLRDEEDQERAALDLVERGRAQVVVVTLGAAGVLAASAGGILRVRAPTVPIASKVGAGDSTLAGVTLGLARGWPLDRAVRLGVAAGAAAVMTPGTELCRRDDVERLFARMEDEGGAHSAGR